MPFRARQGEHFLLPFRERGTGFRRAFADGGIDGGDACEDFVRGLRLFGSASRDGGFLDAIEEGIHAVIFVVGERVVFVGVALGALGGEAENGFPDGIDAVENALDAELLGLRAALLVGHRVAQESGGDAVVLRGVRQEIAGDLFHNELIVGHVRVHRGDDPIPVEMMIAWQVFLVAGGIRVAGGIQPLARPALTEVRAGDQAPGLGIRRSVLGNLLQGRRQSC